MAPLTRESVSNSDQQSQIARQSNVEYLLAARQILLGNDNICPTANRYYRTRINNLLDYDKDNIDKFFQSALDSCFCVHCGNPVSINAKKFKQSNRSKKRTHCRHLKGICMKSCHYCRRRETRLEAYVVKILEPRLAGTIALAKKPKPSNKEKEKLAPVHTTPVSQVKRRLPQRTHIEKDPTVVSKGPEFSSRLRAFSCLLKE